MGRNIRNMVVVGGVVTQLAVRKQGKQGWAERVDAVRLQAAARGAWWFAVRQHDRTWAIYPTVVFAKAWKRGLPEDAAAMLLVVKEGQ